MKMTRIIECAYCGKRKAVTGDRYAMLRRRFCSKACQHQAETPFRSKLDEDLQIERINAYWEKVKDPHYYSGLRMPGHSSLHAMGHIRGQSRSSTQGKTHS